ncbi:NgoMIV family type II restriction endonuclease [Kocuria sp. HSID16901]|uniref:NgoMIV family type II restriction endonuclease n=1 Tax=Kocuria sp. HSID16901 TaxID=2419505 RepID=UPI000660F98B|nr:NgoMIV family type II restriction endonuclease [Kocuria sp. HSID16901]RUQ20926.1 restriction endonuclease [Kocuria sp. HSID16901]
MSRRRPQHEPEEQFLFSLDLTEFAGEGAQPESKPRPDASEKPGAPAEIHAVEGADPKAPEPPNLREAEAEMTRAEIAASRRNDPEYLMDKARRVFHRALLDERVLVVDPNSGVPSNADKDSASSIRYAQAMTDGIGGVPEARRAPGHGVRRNFERAVAAYLKSVMRALDVVRPGEWTVRRLGDVADGQGAQDASTVFEQYEHVSGLREAIAAHRDLRALIGHDSSIIAPDVVVARAPVADSELNATARLVDPLGPLASASPLRSAVQEKSLLHAVVACKWTLRSDRAEQVRSEARHLIRNRRGRVPHLVLVTGEPMPSRLAAVALGTGDIDCVYHVGLHELLDAIDPATDPAGADLLHTMVQGRRLKDISDLPLDLAL